MTFKICYHKGMFCRNPLDTSGVICDFCANLKPVVRIYQCTPFMLGGIPRSQFMACAACYGLIHNRNMRALVTQAADLLPKEARRQARSHFNSVYTEFFNNLLMSSPVQPSHIFDLHVLRSRSGLKKCEFKLSPTCTDVAFIQINDFGWKNSCVPCAMQLLGSTDPAVIVGHQRVRGIRRNPDEPNLPDDWDEIRRQGDKEYIKKWGSLCQQCEGFVTVCDVCDDFNCDCQPCGCHTDQRRNPDEDLRRLERDALSDPDAAARLHHTRRRRGLPGHQHDCDACVFLGTRIYSPEGYVPTRSLDYPEKCSDDSLDLYICPPTRQGSMGSLIIRYGCDGPEYWSMGIPEYRAASQTASWQNYGVNRRFYDEIYQMAIERGLA